MAKLACYVNADPKNPAGWERTYGEAMPVSVMTLIATLFPESYRFSARRLVKNQEYPAQEVAQDAHKNLRPFDRYLKSFVYEIFFFSRPDVLWACRVTCEVTCCLKYIIRVPYPSPIGQWRREKDKGFGKLKPFLLTIPNLASVGFEMVYWNVTGKDCLCFHCWPLISESANMHLLRWLNWTQGFKLQSTRKSYNEKKDLVHSS